MNQIKQLIIIGAGGFTKSIVDSLDHQSYNLVGFIDSFKKGQHIGFDIIANNIDDIAFPDDYVYFIGVGDPNTRHQFYTQLNERGLEQINIIDPSAMLAKDVKLGNGIYIGKMCIINSGTTLADGVVVNTRSLIEHGNDIQCCSNITTNVVLNGDVTVGKRTFVGSCTVVNGQITIGANTIIGSGSVVIRNIGDNIVVAGSPTRLIREITE
ncbi:NeuD/PglB/VioB family sugar acetyltransferase [Photobacterium lutimaris]|uniref:NeuD/PglB/VioB family sugar acetyltransferase n=1 Tax=Photobacterium lutimaris TaxID=388278 RepID=UPI001AAD10CC|nr:NeuD/PglB/VioB family sugar acetyltransferase [Photobacterium lutimaris]